MNTFVVEWRGHSLLVHYEQEIDQRDNENREEWLARAEWSWGPADGSFLVPCTEAHALRMVGTVTTLTPVFCGTGDA